MAKSSMTTQQAAQGVQAFFGRSPESVVEPLHRAMEAMNWMGALFRCIEDANANGGARDKETVQALSSLGAYVAADYHDSIVGVPADELQACIEAAQAGGEA